jgi:predicted DNA-binding transcriptional regulator AlpA
MQPQLISIKQFCADHGISRSFLYKLVALGRGPRLSKLGTRTLISAEAAADWRRDLEQAGARQ